MCAIGDRGSTDQTSLGIAQLGEVESKAATNETYLVIRIYLVIRELPALDSEWVRVSPRPVNGSDGTQAISIDVSACLTQRYDRYLNIRASRLSNISEPALGWTRGSNTSGVSSTGFSTLSVRRQLGTIKEKLSEQERGVMKLDHYEDAKTELLLTPMNTDWAQWM